MVKRFNKITFTFNWKIVAVSLAFFPVLIGLGLWQLDRAEQKRELLSAEEQQKSLPPLPIESVIATTNTLDLQHRQVVATGNVDTTKVFFLDNRTFSGRVGYEAIVLMAVDGVGTLLVNLGWIAAPASRDMLPSIEIPGAMSVRGSLWKPTENRMIRQLENSTGWPKRIQLINLQSVSALLERPVIDYVLRIDRDDPHALSVNWTVANVSPQKHIGYAVQWFTMALALAVAVLCASSNLGTILKNNNEM